MTDRMTDHMTDHPSSVAARLGVSGPITPAATAKWIAIVAVLFFGGTEAETLGFPAPHLFEALVVGLVLAVSGLTRVQMPGWLYTTAQAITGVVLGTYVSWSSVTAVGHQWVAVAAVSALTLGLSLLLGVALARRTDLDPATASLGMIAGGSAGVVASSDDLGADARQVAFIQYLRLVLVVVSAPLLVRYVLHPIATGAYGAVGPKEIEVGGTLGAYIFCVAVALIGALVALWLRLPAGALIGPLILAAVLTGTGAVHRVTPPEFPRETAFTLIGLAIGLRFTREAIVRMGRLLPTLFVFVVLLIVTTGLLAWGLSAVTSINLLNAYLATTPGGINAVLVVAFASGAHTGFVFAVQTLRLFIMVLAAPVLVRWVIRRVSTPAAHPASQRPPTRTPGASRAAQSHGDLSH
jgi:membrane AbrB-like protein